jgi:hypothetical protein
MSSGHDHARLQSLGTVVSAPESGLRFMRRRRVGTADRNGDPLDGLVNMFTVAVAFAVALLVAVLMAAGLGGLLTDENLTIITNPGTPEMQVIVKEGDQITKLDMESGAETSGTGTLLGSFFRLADGTIIWVPAGQAAPDGSTPAPAATPTPGATPTPAPYPTSTPAPYPTPTLTPSTAYPTTPPTPTPSVTLTPDAGATPRSTS